MTPAPALLIVESDRHRLDAMTRHFIRSGFHVTPLAHPRQAMAACARKHFDGAIMARRLPEMRGPELADMVGRHVRGLKPVIVDRHESDWSAVEDEVVQSMDRGFFDASTSYSDEVSHEAALATS
ncbi:MAG: response regulator [Planctomycetales bacterium]|nr:response regulator [Planctomycetales bacterium]MCA9209202.1 response regulator [Planctomycetales bacterium]